MTNGSTTRTKNMVEVGGELLVMSRGPEPAYPLRFYEFRILREANSYHATKEKRNIAITTFVSCLIGAISTYLGIDWVQGAASVEAFLFICLVVASVTSFLLMIFFHLESKKGLESSAYTELIERINLDLGPQTKPKD